MNAGGKPLSPTDIVALSMLINLVLFVVVVFVTYMFYARLRDIADELRKFRIVRKFRIAYEMAEDNKARGSKPTP